MKGIFVHSHVFKYDSNNVFYTEGQFPYKMLKSRYLPHCEKLILASRGEYINDVSNLDVSSGAYIENVILPNITSILSRGKKINELKKQLRELLREADFLIARLPSEHSIYAIEIARDLKVPYLIEVVGDTFSSLWNHGNILGKVLAPLSYLRTRKIIKNAPYAIFVTKRFLQAKYPVNANAITESISNVEIEDIDEELLKLRVEKINKKELNSSFEIGLIGSYSSKYKGIDTAIKCIKGLKDLGYNCSLNIVGTGNNDWLIKLAVKNGVRDRINFIGRLPSGLPILNWLDTQDIYIQPSLTEGLPRALIEAMSRGLPCVGSTAGGIPELLDAHYIHDASSYKDLRNKIKTLLTSKDNMLTQANRNILEAKEFTSTNLNDRRNRMFTTFFKREIEE